MLNKECQIITIHNKTDTLTLRSGKMSAYDKKSYQR